MLIDQMLINQIETGLKIAAILATAGFFVWKLLTGWLIINLQVSLDLKRQSYDEESDFLSVQVNLKKGSTDTLRLRDVVVRVKAEGTSNKPTLIEFPELTPLAVEGGKLNWAATEPAGKKLTLSPDESMQLARAVLVPKGQVALVEAAVLGDRTFWSKGFQWRASAVSLPKCHDVTTE